MVGDTEEETSIEVPSELQCPELDLSSPTDCGLSLHDLSGTEDLHTIKLSGILRGKPFQLLVDTDSTHNFISLALVKQLKLAIVKCSPLRVQLANGTSTQCLTKVINLNWKMGMTTFTSDFFAIPLGGYEAILGVQWLTQVSPIGFDFSK